MRATLIDADGRIFALEDIDLSRPLAEQRLDLAGAAMPAALFYTITDAPTFDDTRRTLPHARREAGPYPEHRYLEGDD